MRTWYEKAAGRNVDADILREMVHYMHGSLPSVIMSPFFLTIFIGAAFYLTGDKNYLLLVGLGYAAVILKIYNALRYAVDCPHGPADRAASERWQLRYLLFGLPYSLLLGLIAAYAAFDPQDAAFVLAMTMVLTYGSGIVVYVAARPYVANTICIGAAIPAYVGTVLCSETWRSGMAVVYVLAIVYVAKATAQQYRAFFELYRTRKCLRDCALTDALTGLPNRRALDEALDSVPKGSDVAILFIDLDGFKPVNDTFGHNAGDALLREIAHTLSSSISVAGFVARCGGDEFVVVLRDGNARFVEETAESIRKRISRLYDFDGGCAEIGASIGIASGTAGQSNLASLVREADEAMYDAKRAGRGRIAGYANHAKNLQAA
ncbi:diguanylate cyclase [Fulvimarina pelagi HTCC2506]|uniref:diguanylate cyclase n=1 Tax=Fulvimarina pelagi HTCC2506 TaxID=314231 RepID=Q0G275_9HYPH|nr:GGDEF domain-containing protein [Fulvimarina pelagi]EAU41323.1 diguanylate cyclase [Fulvimarina pelagi HTCC2506]